MLKNYFFGISGYITALISCDKEHTISYLQDCPRSRDLNISKCGQHHIPLC